jgi:hypothetical protein
MKLKLTEYQNNMLLEFQKRAYSFDWDDNILFMPTKVFLDKRVGQGWVPISVSTEEFAEIRKDIGKLYRYRNNSKGEAFKNFSNYISFIDDTKEALRKKSFGPSFGKFIEALTTVSDFSIITARGNPPQAIKDAIKLIIYTILSYDERIKMEENLQGTTIDQYLNLQDYYPVSSEYFLKQFDIESSADNPEIGKTVALKNFVSRIVSLVGKIKNNSKYSGISIGYSDDDLGNVKSAEKYIEETLRDLYPDVTFLIYDTSDPKNTKKKRIVIKK